MRHAAARGEVCGQRLSIGPGVEGVSDLLRQRRIPHLQEVRQRDAEAVARLVIVGVQPLQRGAFCFAVRLVRYSILMLPLRMTAPQRLLSASTWRPKSSGEPSGKVSPC